MQAPGLAVVLVGARKDSETYVRNKKKACEEVGIASYGETMPQDATEEEVLKVTWSSPMLSSHAMLILLLLCCMHLLFSVTSTHVVADMLRCYTNQLVLLKLLPRMLWCGTTTQLTHTLHYMGC